ncbi:MAG: histidine phosphatase family protein [Candidatus Aminicenantia bacterium]
MRRLHYVISSALIIFLVILIFSTPSVWAQVKIFLARHGQTDWNKEGRLQGWTNTDLNDLGKKQANALFNLLKEEKIQVIYTSTLKRSIQTAKPFIKNTRIPVRNLDVLKEINLGLLQGHKNTEKEVREELLFMDKDVKHRAPQGESFQDVFNRISFFVDKIIEKHRNETILIIGHSGVNSIILAKLLNIPLEKAVNIYQPNDLVFTVYYLPSLKSPTVVWTKSMN